MVWGGWLGTGVVDLYIDYLFIDSKLEPSRALSYIEPGEKERGSPFATWEKSW